MSVKAIACALAAAMLAGASLAGAGDVAAQDGGRTILAVFAHPDDERIVGPLLSRYAREGHAVYLAIATDGRLGVREHAGIPAGDSLAALRAHEARCATDRLGIHAPILIGLEDAGLASFAALTRLRDELGKLFRQLKPDMVVTFGPEGGTGHPDHRLTGVVVTEVVQGGGEGFPEELYYASLPAERMQTAPPAQPRVTPMPRRYLTVRVPFAAEDLAATHAAFACHASQYTPDEQGAVMRALEHGWDGAVWLRPWSGGERGRADQPFSDVQVSWAVVDNIDDAGFRFVLTLTNNGRQPLPASGWELYFNMMRMVDTVGVPPSIRVTHINGDHYRLRPTERFRSLAPGDSVALPLSADAAAIKTGDAPRGFYFVVDEAPIPVGHVLVAPFVRDAQTMRSPDDRLPVPTPASHYRDNSVLSVLSEEAVGRILPTPVRFEERPGSWALDAAATIHHEAGLEREARHLADGLEQVTGGRPRITGPVPSEGRTERSTIVLRTDAALRPEGYTLTIDPQRGADIVGGDAAGVFYGVQSFRALLPLDAYATPRRRIEIPAARVEDEPGLRHRGMHLDVARNFQHVESVRTLLDLMSIYKLNRFHFHLTDDEGWRLAIDALPELTGVGGRRGHTLDERDHLMPSLGSGPYPDVPPGSGHYTREQYIDLLRYAAERHIQVIPEIDLPGHARAAIVAMESRYRRLSGPDRDDAASEFRLHDPDDESSYRSVQRFHDNVVNVCIESTYRFIETVVDELVAMYAEAGAPLSLVHVGGDEVPPGVWERSPACRSLLARTPELSRTPELFDYFLRRTADILHARGLTLAGWEEVALADRFHVPGPKEPNPEFVERGFVPSVWNAVWGWGAEDLGYRLANAGYEVVLSNAGNLYFDLAYDKDPAEPGLYWAGFVDTRKAWEFLPFDLFRTARRDIAGNPIDESRYVDATRPTAEGRGNIRGMQGQLWSETLVEPSRMEYMAFPRILALAERAWAPEPAWSLIDDRAQREPVLREAWNEFANRLGQRELKRLDHLHGGIGYRLPLPGAVLEDGVLHANVSYPGLAIHYTTDGSVPSTESPRYREPIAVAGPVSLRVFDTRGRGGRTVVVRP